MGLEVPMSIILDDSREVFDRPRLSVGISDDHIVLMTYTRVENDVLKLVTYLRELCQV